jgi:hypothetical protein
MQTAVSCSIRVRPVIATAAAITAAVISAATSAAATIIVLRKQSALLPTHAERTLSTLLQALYTNMLTCNKQCKTVCRYSEHSQSAAQLV